MTRLRKPQLPGLSALVLGTLLPGIALPQSGTGQLWDDFGPWNSHGAFQEITKVYDASISASAVAADPLGRVVTLSEWQDAPIEFNHDCAVTRHLGNARTLDMSFTGELEATRRIALDLGGSDDDYCTALAVDSSSRPVVVGRTSTAGEDTAFVVRLRATNGLYDTSFSTDGWTTLATQLAFAGDETRFDDVETYADGRILACGSVRRGTDRNMLVMRFLSTGALDHTFNSTGYREIDWNGPGADTDSCSRLLILPDDRIVLAGATNANITGNISVALVRLLANGSPDPSFTADGRVTIDDGLSYTTPEVADLAYDSGRGRLVVAATTTGLAAAEYGTLLAVTASGADDTSFSGNGQRTLRFSDFGEIFHPRDTGDTRLTRVLMRPDGRFYIAGTHQNSAADAATYGASDVAIARLLPDGRNDDDLGTGFSGDGVAFFAYSEMGHSDVTPAEERLRVSDTLEDAIFYRGNVLLLSDTNRYPSGVWSEVSYGLGPLVPVLAGVVADRIDSLDFEFDGLAEPTNSYPPIPVPAGYGRYCSVREILGGSYGLLAQGATSDPCQQLIDGNPNVTIERAGLYSLSGPNNVLATCNGGYIGLHPGNGTAPFNAAFAATAGRTDCIFIASPDVLPIFSLPHTGGPTAGTAQSFNHDVFNIGLDVTAFGQTPIASHPLAHWIDLNGIQECDGPGTPDDCPSCDPPFGGINEPAIDIPVSSVRSVLSVAAGRVASTVPRYVLRYTPVGNDPHQREVFVRYSVGTGRYSEQFTMYYAHMSETLVRRGDVIAAGTVLGHVGSTGATAPAGNEHLHISLYRHTNLSFRASWEHGFAHVDFDQGKVVAAMDPFGWRGAAATDPWTWRFRANEGAGCWNINLWKPGEEPTMN